MAFWMLDINGGLWMPAKNSLYEHRVVTYGLAQNPPCHTAMATKGQH